MTPSNPNGRNRARRKDPFRRAVRAPVKQVERAGCPWGQCEHAGLLHAGRALALEQRSRLFCEICDCKEPE